MKRVNHVISHWHVLIDNFNTSAQEFYKSVEAAIRERELPDITFSRHDFIEGGLLSTKRWYLRVERKFVAFDICAAPYGRGYFCSWWLTRLGPKHPILYILAFIVAFNVISFIINGLLGDMMNLFAWIIIIPLILYGLGRLVQAQVISSEEEVLMVPFVGWLYARFFNPVTYYSLDTAIMFREMIHSAVLEAIDELSTSAGMRSLADSERKPIYSEFLSRSSNT